MGVGPRRRRGAFHTHSARARKPCTSAPASAGAGRHGAQHSAQELPNAKLQYETANSKHRPNLGTNITPNMDAKASEQMMHQTTMNLTKAATEVSKKIKEQTMLLEEITSESRVDMDKFASNNRAFNAAIDKLENDKRNKLIAVLLIIILLLLYYLRLK